MGKKLYCCKTANKGCPSELPPPSGLPPSGLPPAKDTSIYDCDAGYHHCMHCLKESWSPQKIDYCCKNFHKGCAGEEPERAGHHGQRCSETAGQQCGNVYAT